MTCRENIYNSKVPKDIFSMIKMEPSASISTEFQGSMGLLSATMSTYERTACNQLNLGNGMGFFFVIVKKWQVL